MSQTRAITDAGPFLGIDVSILDPKDWTLSQKLHVFGQLCESKWGKQERNAMGIKYNISQRLLRKWMTSVRDDPNWKPSVVGRPDMLDAEGDEYIIESIKEHMGKAEAPFKYQLLKIVQNAAQHSLQRSGKAGIVPKICNDTLLAIRKRLKISRTTAARSGTVARKRNMRDHRNFS